MDTKVVYKDRYNIEYTREPKEVVQTYHFGGLPLYNTIGWVRIVAPKPSIQSLPREESRKTTIKNGRDPTSITHGVPLPTSTTRVGDGLGVNGRNPTTRESTTPHTSIGAIAHEIMGITPTHAQS